MAKSTYLHEEQSDRLENTGSSVLNFNVDNVRIKINANRKLLIKAYHMVHSDTLHQQSEE